MRDPRRWRDRLLPPHIAAAPEIPTLYVLAGALDAAQAAIRAVWGEDDTGGLHRPQPFEEEAELAQAVLDLIRDLGAAVRRYREAMLWRVPGDTFQPIDADGSQELLDVDDLPL